MDTPPNQPNTSFNLADEESRKKYIRTFAGDMEIVKKGGTPDLKPLQPIPEAPTEEPALPAPPPPAPPPIAPPPVEPPVVPAEPPAPPPPPQSSFRTPAPETPPLETYTNDFLQKVKDTRASTATVLAAEEDAKGHEEAPKKSGWGMGSVIAGSILIILGCVGVYIGYTDYLAKMQPVTLAPVVSAPIFVDEQQQITGATPAALLDAIVASVNNPPATNDVRLLYTNMSTTTGNDIFSALQFPAPDILLRNIVASQSMAGIVNIGGEVSPFFILSVTSYSDTFAGMLSWETTMPSDLSALFPPYPATVPVVSTTTMATTTVATTTATTTKKKAVTMKTPANTSVVATSTPPTPIPAFDDEVVDNHDVRIYRDAQGRSVLMYGYWNQTTLVIARDPSSFTEILRRLGTSNTQ